MEQRPKAWKKCPKVPPIPTPIPTPTIFINYYNPIMAKRNDLMIKIAMFYFYFLFFSKKTKLNIKSLKPIINSKLI